MVESHALNKLLAPFPLDEFFQRHWEKQFLHLRRDVNDYYGQILSIDQLDSYFQPGNMSPHFFRVIKEGTDYDLARWTSLEHRSHADPSRVVSVQKLFALFSEGATLIINAAQTGIPTLDSFCKELSRELQSRVQPNIYITPPNQQGLFAHYDPHDVFVLQISGTKRWNLYRPPVELPVQASSVRLDGYAEKEPDHVIELRPGDLLYLPRGTVHLANSANNNSIHVTIGLLAKYWFNLLEELAYIAEQDPAFRRAIPHALTTEAEKVAFINEFSALLEQLLAKTPVQQLVDRERSALAANNVDTSVSMKDLLQLDHLTSSSTVSRRNNEAYEIEQEENSFVLKFGQEKVSLPKFMQVSFESLLGPGPIAVEEIKGPLTDKSKLELTKTLVQAGFLRIEAV